MVVLVAATTLSAHEGMHDGSAPILTDAQIQFLTTYEQIRAALAHDGVTAAKTDAATLHTPVGDQLAKAQSLNAARIAFRNLSGEAVHLVHGRTGFYVVHCPMVDADWVQRDRKISNPYVGGKMHACGVITN